MRASDFQGGEYLKAENIGDSRPIVTIERYTIENIEDQRTRQIKKMVCLHFVGKDKSLLCNATNLTRCSNAWGDEMDHWQGKQLQLYVEQVEFGGKLVPGLRVTPIEQPQNPAGFTAPSAQAPAQPEPSSGGQPAFDDDIPF